MSPVLGVQLSDDRVIVVLKQEVRIYSIKELQLLAKHTTADNPNGLCALSGKTIAFPGRTRGHVNIVGIENKDVSIIPAHSSALRALAFSPNGELVATASEQGTLIRVWNTRSNAKLVELRRGADPATIFSLGFSPSGALLACTSDKGTLHVYDVPYLTPTPERQPKPIEIPRTAKANQLPNPAETLGRPASTIGGSTAPSVARSYEPMSPRMRHASPGSIRSSDDADSASISDETGDSSKGGGQNQWGLLGKIPFLPQYFRDAVSFASAEFATAADPASRGILAAEAASVGLVRLPQGIIALITEESLALVGAGVNTC